MALLIVGLASCWISARALRMGIPTRTRACGVMTTGRRRRRHPWGISSGQLSQALGRGSGNGAADNNACNDADDANGGPRHNKIARNDGEAQELHPPIQADEEEKEGPRDGEMHVDATACSRGATGSSTCNADEGDSKAKVTVEVAERFSYGFSGDSASENDGEVESESESKNDNNESTTGSQTCDDDEERYRSDTILSPRGLAQQAEQALETQQEQTQCRPPTQVLVGDEQLALSLLARERKQLQKRRAQARADEKMAQEVQSQLDRLSFAESITPSVGDDEDATNRKEKRRQSIEADAEFATILSSMEDANTELLRRQRQQQEENDLALARAEGERDRLRHEVKHSSASGSTANADSTTASLLSTQQIQLDELLARTEAARDEIRLELRNRAVEHDEAVARAEQARERAARDVTDEAMAQTLQEEHIRDHWHQGQEYVPPRPEEEDGQVQADSLPPH